MSRTPEDPTADDDRGTPSLKIVAVLFAVLLVVVIATVVVLGIESGNQGSAPGTTVTLPTPTTTAAPAADPAPAVTGPSGR